MTAPAGTFSLGVRDRRRIVVDLENGTFRELVGTVTHVYPTTIRFLADDGGDWPLFRRQILHAADPAAPVTVLDDPLHYCVRGGRYRFIHHGGPDNAVVDTVGTLRRVLTRAVLVDVGHINLTVIARDSILLAPEVH